MGCGCKGGTWTPPSQEQTSTGTAKSGAKSQPVKTAGAVGPSAPGYFHGPDPA
jgi:hypothetical protein